MHSRRRFNEMSAAVEIQPEPPSGNTFIAINTGRDIAYGNAGLSTACKSTNASCLGKRC